MAEQTCIFFKQLLSSLFGIFLLQFRQKYKDACFQEIELLVKKGRGKLRNYSLDVFNQLSLKTQLEFC